MESHVRQVLFLAYDKIWGFSIMDSWAGNEISYTLYSSYLLKDAMNYRYDDILKYSVEYIAGGNYLIGCVAIF